ncbi:hypothetical protein C7S17_4069 [Burkholderia thailandensis]|nr:hypothetical protein [Burkholderia thailandensis]
MLQPKRRFRHDRRRSRDTSRRNLRQALFFLEWGKTRRFGRDARRNAAQTLNTRPACECAQRSRAELSDSRQKLAGHCR